MSNVLTSSYIRRQLTDAGAVAIESREFGRMFGLKPAAVAQIEHRLIGAGVLHPIRRGCYLIDGPLLKEASGNTLYLGPRYRAPAYASFWSAFHYYGWTEQVPRLAYFVTTRRSGAASWGAFRWRFVHCARSRFFGYSLVRQGALEMVMAEPEKAIIDSLWRPSYAGGIARIDEALRTAGDQLRSERLASYARLFGSESVLRRLGYLLHGTPIGLPEPIRPRGRYYVRLDPSRPRRGRFDRQWLVIDNRGV